MKPLTVVMFYLSLRPQCDCHQYTFIINETTVVRVCHAIIYSMAQNWPSATQDAPDKLFRIWHARSDLNRIKHEISVSIIDLLARYAQVFWRILKQDTL